MYLILYAIDNKAGFERHTFDLVDSDFEIAKQLLKADADNKCDIHVYDMSTKSYSSLFLNADDFVEDCNNEEINLGLWWTIALNLTESELLNIRDACY